MEKSVRQEQKGYCPRFGQLAVELGFITPDQLKEAMQEQLDDDLSGRPHRILGAIFFDKGWMTPQQVDLTLNRMFQALLQETP